MQYYIAISLYSIRYTKTFLADASPHRYFTTSPYSIRYTKAFLGRCFATSLFHHIAISPHHHIALRYTKTFLSRCFATSLFHHIATLLYGIQKRFCADVPYGTYVSLCFYVFQNCSSKNLTKIRRLQKVALPLHPLRQRGLIEQYLHPKLLASKAVKKLCKKLCQN